MNSLMAVRIWNEAIETTVGGDSEGNPYFQTTVLGGVTLGREIGTIDFYHAKHNPGNLAKASAFLREWVDGLDKAVEEAR